MHTVVITTDTKANANLLVAFLKEVKTVRTIAIDPLQKDEYNWTNPARPATDEEFELMISEAETEIELGLGIPAEIARKQTKEAIKRWRQK